MSFTRTLVNEEYFCLRNSCVTLSFFSNTCGDISTCPLIATVQMSSKVLKVISRFMGYLENRLSEFNEITAVGFVIADLVQVVHWHFSACIGFRDIRGGIWRPKLTHIAMGPFMLCARHNAIFTALPYKHNGRAALKSTMKVRHIVFIVVIYFYFKDR